MRSAENKEPRVIARGKTSEIILTDNRTVVKRLRPGATRNNLRKEYLILKILEPLKLAPRPIELREKTSELVMSYVPGLTLKEFLAREQSERKIKLVLIKLLHRAAILDLLRVNHNQLHLGKNVLVTKDLDVYIVDFEKATLGSRTPRNVGQVVGYYLMPRLSGFNRRELQRLVRAWKQLLKDLNSLGANENSRNGESQGKER